LELFKKAIAIRSNSSTDIIDTLLAIGIISEKDMIRYNVRNEYYKRLKEQKQTCFDIKLDLSVEFDLSETTILNIIYRDTHLKI